MYSVPVMHHACVISAMSKYFVEYKSPPMASNGIQWHFSLVAELRGRRAGNEAVDFRHSTFVFSSPLPSISSTLYSVL